MNVGPNQRQMSSLLKASGEPQVTHTKTFIMLTPETNITPSSSLLGEASRPKTMLGKQSSEAVIEMEHRYGAHNYHPLPVVFSSAEGIHNSG